MVQAYAKILRVWFEILRGLVFRATYTTSKTQKVCLAIPNKSLYNIMTLPKVSRQQSNSAMTQQSNHEEDAEFEDVPGGQYLSPEELEDRNQELLASQHNSRLIVLPEGATLSDAVAMLARSVPQNEFGLPTAFYRSDLLPYPITQLTEVDADNALISLDYSEGYPQFQNKIWWFQLPHESFSDYVLFQRYLEQAEIHGLRQLQLLSMEQSVTLQKIADLANQYYWADRARAYDLFQLAADRKRREIRQRKTEDKHFDMAAGLLERLTAKIEDPDFFNNIDAVEGIQILRLLVNLQRASLGLAINGNAGKADLNPDAARSGRQVMDSITKTLDQADDGMGISDNLIVLMQDPNFVKNAQALVFQVTRGGENGQGQGQSTESGAAVTDEQ